MTSEEFAKLVANLPQADSLDLYRLEYVIRKLYDEPRRKVAARARINLGMMVEYFDNRDGAFHRGKIIRAQEAGVTIDDLDRRIRLSGVPYAALNLDRPGLHSEPETWPGSSRASAEPPAAPMAEKRAPFKIGDRVSFTDHDMCMLVGTVVRVNAKSISVAADGSPGHWRVSPGLLTHLIDA